MMTNDEIITVVQAAKDGKTIQYRNGIITEGGWSETTVPLWDFNHLDFRVKPEKKVMYVNVYEGCQGHSSRAQADAVGDGRISCVRVEFEKGQFDS